MSRQDILDAAKARAKTLVRHLACVRSIELDIINGVIEHIGCGEFVEARRLMQKVPGAGWDPLFIFCDGLCLGVDGAFAAIQEAAE